MTTAHCPLPTANCQLPTANCQLSTANCLYRPAQTLICAAILSAGSTRLAPPRSMSSAGMPKTTADSSDSAMVRPPRFDFGEGVGAVIAHAGQHDADDMRGIAILQRRAAQQLDRGMPEEFAVFRLGQHRHFTAAVSNHHVRPALADIDGAGLERHRLGGLHHRQRAQSFMRSAKGPVKAGMCWATRTGQGKSAGQRQDVLQGARPAGGDADEHQTSPVSRARGERPVPHGAECSRGRPRPPPAGAGQRGGVRPLSWRAPPRGP